jgi:single-strand DNA-binding protein
LNWGPLRPERSALPGCATPREGQRVATLGADRFEFSRYVARGDNEEVCVNTVNVIGNLATEIEVREVGDKQLAKFLLAVNRVSKEGGADFVGVSVWERQAELCAQYLTKGQRVGIEGYLRSSSWEEEGKRRREVEIVARRVDFLSAPRPDGPGAEVVPFEPAVA